MQARKQAATKTARLKALAEAEESDSDDDFKPSKKDDDDDMPTPRGGEDREEQRDRPDKFAKPRHRQVLLPAACARPVPPLRMLLHPPSTRAAYDPNRTCSTSVVLTARECGTNCVYQVPEEHYADNYPRVSVEAMDEVRVSRSRALLSAYARAPY